MRIEDRKQKIGEVDDVFVAGITDVETIVHGIQVGEGLLFYVFNL